MIIVVALPYYTHCSLFSLTFTQNLTVIS